MLDCEVEINVEESDKRTSVPTVYDSIPAQYPKGEAEQSEAEWSGVGHRPHRRFLATLAPHCVRCSAGEHPGGAKGTVLGRF